MLLFCCLCSIFLYAQNEDDPAMEKEPIKYSTAKFEKDWAAIDSLQNSGLPKSALENLEKLFAKVRKDNNPAQFIKCLLYREKYTSQTTENGKEATIKVFEAEIATSDFPVKPILQSMLAELYKNIFDEKRYAISQRTNTVNFKNDDVNTWASAQFFDKISELYLASTKDERCKEIGMEYFEAITEGTDLKYRPTLYDFLAFRAIDYFSDNQTLLTEPSYKFEIKEEEALQPAAIFLKYKPIAKDTSSYKLQIIKLLQNIISFHIEEEDPTPYLDAELHRINFVYTQTLQKNKDKQYLATMEDLLIKYELHPKGAAIMALQAKYYLETAADYTIGESEEKRLMYQKAMKICNDCIAKYKNNTACSLIKASIEQSSYTLKMENQIAPNKPILAKIEYKNKEAVTLKFLKISAKQKEDYVALSQRHYENENQAKMLELLKKLPVSLEKTVKLPAADDYREHSTELKIEGLPLGEYVISYDEQNPINNTLYLNVTNIAYVYRMNHEQNNEFVMMNRTTGEPLVGVVAELFNTRWDEATRNHRQIKIGNAYVTPNGFLYPKAPDNVGYTVRFHLGTDTLDTNDQFYESRYKNPIQTYQTTNFFLDRAIYRPGQTVYFKGITLNFDEKRMPKIMKNTEVRVSFKDVNYQEIAVMNLRTNDFGTFNGEFTAPKTGLLGQMHIESSIGGNSVFFRVEEYKRPKFEVVFKPIEGSFKINDDVKVVGNAKAFAGSNVDGAKVKFRVVRNVNYPFWGYYCWWRPFPSLPSMEIVNGETVTDAQGNFAINFKAIPDEKSDLEGKPQFDYTVYADVVDINGETHSSQTSVKVGTIAINADINVAEKINAKQFKMLKISTLNLNGQPEEAQGTVKIQLLKSPTILYKNRLWAAPDKPSLSKEEFEKNFPDIPFDNEDDVKYWKVKADILEEKFDTKKSNDFDVSKTIWQSGNYILTLDTKDKFGTPISVKKYFTIYDPSAKVAPANIPSFVMLENSVLQPGDTARLFVGSAYENLKVLFEIVRGEKIQFSKWMPINKLEELKFKIEEADRGGIHTQITYVKENRLYQEQFEVQVPWKNKELNIEYQSFRDKLLPGQDEEWRIKISGAKKEKVAAEMVAALYDASLDQFARNAYSLSPFPNLSYNSYRFNGNSFGIAQATKSDNNYYDINNEEDKSYKLLRWFDYWYSNQYLSDVIVMRPMAVSATMAMPEGKAGAAEVQAYKNKGNAKLEDSLDAERVSLSKDIAEPKKPSDPVVTPRTNLKETVFFLPNLMTDAEGNIIIKFKMNEALTKWRFLALAHTQDLKIASSEKEIVTQKDLMVMPNAPRFMREGDVFYFSSKITNLSDKDISGTVKLELFDAVTDQPCNVLFGNANNILTFNALKGQSTAAAWKLNIPIGKTNALTWRVTAISGNQSDGEQNALPILSNRMLVTETKPLPVRGGETKEFTFEAMQKATASTTLQHQNFTLEFTQNPAWYAVQALPYLMEYPHDCTEQIFSRYYANALATQVVNSSPKIKQIFDKWKAEPKGANREDVFLSNLAKNQELKSALLEETPWVMQSCNEEQQKKNIALLFDMSRMSDELSGAADKISERQASNGGFAWFPGGRENWYITQYLVEGFGHLEKLKVKREGNQKIAALLPKAIQYIDNQMLDEYKRLLFEVKEKRAKLEDNHLGGMQIHYLYTRSFYKNENMNEDVKKAYQYYMAQAEKYWLNSGIYYEGMIALALTRENKNETPQKIVKSLKERSLNNEELGMYWKNQGGYYWYQMPIETQALMIEVFSEVAKDDKSVEDLKTWLLKNKQTNAWKTTKATASAVYALLMNGQNWIAEDKKVKITIGNKPLDLTKIAQDEGSGYFKTSFFENGKPKVDDVLSLGKIKVENPNKVPVWGAAYWQYFENLDKIKDFQETPLTLKKQLFKEENSDKGLIMKPLEEKTKLNPGDKLKVRIELRVDRDMEYVHMKDARAAGFEPTNVLSQYKYQGGLGYYESTRDAATNFFFDFLPKGTYVFEYPLVINHKGDFSNGITTIQCMYAPEFSSHSAGVRVKVGE
jgi:uncharacterized protein YfaS (alpha-2-macroglobulin family)